MATVLQGAAMKPAAAAGAAVGQRAAAPNLGGGIGLASPGFRRLAFGCGLRRGEQRVRSHSVQAALEPSDKSIEVMRKFSEQYARRSDTFFCVDKGVTSVVIKGLAEHKDSLGAPLCPCRHYDDKVAEVQQGFWNCPCVPMRERKECHCMLFLTADNDFAGQDQAISMEEIKELTANV